MYNLVKDLEGNDTTPLRMIVAGTAGTGKSYLIHCLRLLQQKVCVDGHTLHSLPTKGEFKDLQGEHLNKIQQSLSGIQYLIIDEMSMVGGKKVWSGGQTPSGVSPPIRSSAGRMFLSAVR